jgi:hypothetical protein
MTKLIGTGANQVPTNADLGKLAYQDAIAVGTGTAGQVLQSGGATGSPAWATISTTDPAVVFPDWASPTNTYNSSGTWSKGSLSDDDYVWFYIVNSGGGGGAGTDARAGAGGRAMLIYGNAASLNGATYVVAAAKAGGNSSSPNTATLQNESSLTLGGVAFSPTDISQADDNLSNSLNVNITNFSSGSTSTYLKGSLAKKYVIQTGTLPSGYGQWTSSSQPNGYSGGDSDCVFGGGVGEWLWNGGWARAVSLFAGDGGASGVNSGAGVFPAGGGAGINGSVGGTGAAGQIRVYHV